jgi:hypothetical protein
MSAEDAQNGRPMNRLERRVEATATTAASIIIVDFIVFGSLATTTMSPKLLQR